MCLAVPGRIEEIRAEEGLRVGRVRFGGVTREVVLETLPEAAVGQWVVVHAGVALQLMDEAEARRSLALLEQLEQP